MPEETCCSVCAQGTAEGSGSVNDMPHFTPLVSVRTDTFPSLHGSVWRQEHRPETYVGGEEIKKKVPDTGVEVRKMCPPTWDHDLMRKTRNWQEGKQK